MFCSLAPAQKLKPVEISACYTAASEIPIHMQQLTFGLPRSLSEVSQKSTLPAVLLAGIKLQFQI